MSNFNRSNVSKARSLTHFNSMRSFDSSSTNAGPARTACRHPRTRLELVVAVETVPAPVQRPVRDETAKLRVQPNHQFAHINCSPGSTLSSTLSHDPFFRNQVERSHLLPNGVITASGGFTRINLGPLGNNNRIMPFMLMQSLFRC